MTAIVTRGLLRALLCACALGGGAGLAHATSSTIARPQPASNPQKRAATHHATVARATKTARVANAIGAVPDASVTLHEESIASAAMHPFGEALRDGRIIGGSTPHRLLLFTFDDGPNKQTTPILLEKLDRAGVKAVFFLSAHRIRGTNRTEQDQAAIARDIAARGHIVANHTTFHVALPTLNNDELAAELTQSESIFTKVFGARPWLFRPPYGVHTDRTDRFLADHGYTVMLWNVGTGDFQVRTAEEVFHTWKAVLARRELENGERGGVILMHDTHAWTVEAFDLIFGEIQRRNCDLLHAQEELYDVVGDPTFFFQPRGAGLGNEVADPARLPQDVLAARQAHLREVTQARCDTLAQGSPAQL